MEILARVERGQILLPKTIRLAEGTEVRVLVADDLVEQNPIEAEPLDDAEVLADLSWADGRRFASCTWVQT